MGTLVLLVGLCQGAAPPAAPVTVTLEQVTKIWDRDPHSAFTDLIRWQGGFVCAFRVGEKHVSPDGALQLLHSADGTTWSTLARVTSPVADMRDPKLTTDGGGRLVLLAAGALHDTAQQKHQTYIWTSDDGRTWSGPTAVGEPDCWLWRVTAYQGKHYGFGYDTKQERFIRLYESADARSFTPVTDKLLTDRGYPNETAMVIEEGKALCLLRRDGKAPENTALFGTANAPFKDWAWQDLNVQIGGPSLLRLPAGELLATVRLYSPTVRTAVCRLDPVNAKLHELLTLPSGGDCSYAGMVWHADRLWISYYSSHEGKSAIYLARVRVEKP